MNATRANPRHQPPPRPSTEVPTRVGRYDLLARLGIGGMASVYLARGLGDAGFERLAAVKVMHRGMCADPDFVEMFLDEARVAARLHHPNATAITDLGAEGPQLYMVMEYVEGDTLHAVQFGASAGRHELPLGVALRVVLDALAGLDAAHELRGSDGRALALIHRDVTPHNVLLGVDGAARLADFGIARAASRTAVTSVGVLKGKVPFMAPEHLAGRALDRRADIFSMGVTLWETMSLRRCYPRREAAPFARPAPEPYEALRDIAPRVPAAMDAICARALAFDPADRYPTAAAFAEALEAEFRHEVATQRELGQFVATVAAEKVRVEREAVRASATPIPARIGRPARPHAPVIELRPPRAAAAATSKAPRSLQRPLGDGLDEGEDVTSVAPPRRTAAPPASARNLRLTPPARPAEAGSLFEVPTQAFPLQRPRVSSGTLPAMREPEPQPEAPVEALRPTVGPPRLDLADDAAEAALAPPAPTLSPPRSRRPFSRRARARRAPSQPPSALRALAARLWRLFRAR